MAAPCDIILTSSNYFSWKSHMEDVLRSMRLFMITSGKETEPTNGDKKIKWKNRWDGAHGLIAMSISTDLQFHISRIDEPNLAWEKLESVFGKHNEIRGHQIQNELLSLNPNYFSCIQDYLSKYKTLRLLCVECNINKEDKQCIYHILSKLGRAYFVFVSTFYSMKESLTEANYVEPSLESFCDSLIREQYKLLK